MSLTRRQFGDGIMSMIDCKVSVDKKPDPKGDRVVLTFEYVVLHPTQSNGHLSFVLYIPLQRKVFALRKVVVVVTQSMYT